MFYIDFDNENDMTDLRLKYKKDRIVIEMLNKIEDLQDQVRSFKYFDKIRQWAHDRDLIIGATPEGQFQKLLEEMIELYQALRTDDVVETVDAIGDCIVVLTILAAQKNLDVEYCISEAYEQIKNRKGRMVDGVFVKDVA